MIVCHCHGLTDRDIRAAATRTRARCADELGPVCPAASCCGGCRPVVDEILRAQTGQGGGAPGPERAPQRRSA